MNELLTRLKHTLTPSELTITKGLYKIMQGKSEETINSVKLSIETDTTRSQITHVLKTLYVCGIIDSKSRGTAGTYIKILDEEALKKLVS